MKKHEFRKLMIGDSVYVTIYETGEIPLIEFVVEGKTEKEILIKLGSVEHS